MTIHMMNAFAEPGRQRGISTLAITRRETASWRWPIFMFSYLFAAAYMAAGITYHVALAAGL